MNITSINISQLALIISVCGLIVSFYNVNRQKKASLKNDEERFRRELNLKTSDDFIELLFEIGEFAKNYRTFDRFLDDRNFDGDQELKFNEEFWTLTNKWVDLLADAKSFYLKRKVILKSVENRLREIELKTIELDQKLWAIKDVFGNHQKTEVSISQAKQCAEELITLVNITIGDIQDNFLGKLYK